MIISKKGRLLFVHIPKNGGYSVLHAMKAKYPDTEKILWGHARICDVKGMNLKKYTKFAIVRNPWGRMVSLWAFLWQHKKTYETRSGKRRSTKELVTMGFSDWLLNRGKRSWYITTSDTPQFRWISRDDKIIVDHVLRFENMERELKDVIGLTDIPMRHVSDHGDYREYYNEASRRFVEETYEKDIKEWGYEF